MSQDQTPENQNILQKKIAFANSEHVATVIHILKECGGAHGLVGQTEYETVVNAVTLDAQQDMIKNFINALDSVKQINFTEQ